VCKCCVSSQQGEWGVHLFLQLVNCARTHTHAHTHARFLTNSQKYAVKSTGTLHHALQYYTDPCILVSVTVWSTNVLVDNQSAREETF